MQDRERCEVFCGLPVSFSTLLKDMHTTLNLMWADKYQGFTIEERLPRRLVRISIAMAQMKTMFPSTSRVILTTRTKPAAQLLLKALLWNAGTTRHISENHRSVPSSSAMPKCLLPRRRSLFAESINYVVIQADSVGIQARMMLIFMSSLAT